MLTLCIIPSLKPNADVEKTIESFKKTGLSIKAVVVSCWREINDLRNKGDWFAIFWDNECLSIGLQRALPEHLATRRSEEILILYKRLADDKAEYRMRIMRRGIWLIEDFRPLSPWYRAETILDGWVLEHDNNKVHKLPV